MGSIHRSPKRSRLSCLENRRARLWSCEAAEHRHGDALVQRERIQFAWQFGVEPIENRFHFACRIAKLTLSEIAAIARCVRPYIAFEVLHVYAPYRPEPYSVLFDVENVAGHHLRDKRKRIGPAFPKVQGLDKLGPLGKILTHSKLISRRLGSRKQAGSADGKYTRREVVSMARATISNLLPRFRLEARLYSSRGYS